MTLSTSKFKFRFEFPPCKTKKGKYMSSTDVYFRSIKRPSHRLNFILHQQLYKWQNTTEYVSLSDLSLDLCREYASPQSLEEAFLFFPWFHLPLHDPGHGWSQRDGHLITDRQSCSLSLFYKLAWGNHSKLMYREAESAKRQEGSGWTD